MHFLGRENPERESEQTGKMDEKLKFSLGKGGDDIVKIGRTDDKLKNRN